jgi:salicylate hydroxylase
MAYPIRKHAIYNIVLIHSQQQNPLESKPSTSKCNKQEMQAVYENWNPSITNILRYVPEGDLVRWTMESHEPLSIWHINKTVLIGDCCHSMYAASPKSA